MSQNLNQKFVNFSNPILFEQTNKKHIETKLSISAKFDKFDKFQQSKNYNFNVQNINKDNLKLKNTNNQKLPNFSNQLCKILINFNQF